MDRDQFESAIAEALDQMPVQFAELMENLVIKVFKLFLLPVTLIFPMVLQRILLIKKPYAGWAIEKICFFLIC